MSSAMLLLILTILWPSVLGAIIAEGCFFSLFDPRELLIAEQQIELSPMAAYTIGFLLFWLFCAMASGLTCYLVQTPAAPDESKRT